MQAIAAGVLAAGMTAPVQAADDKIYSVAEAAEVSKHPRKQIVFHYDASMSLYFVHAVQAQAYALRKEGFLAVALPGGPKGKVQLYVAGLTSNKLLYDQSEIEASVPRDYAAAYYKKLIGPPHNSPLE